MRLQMKFVPAAILAAAAITGCSSDSSTGSTSTAANQVTALATLAFSPQSISIKQGDSVTWVFQSVGHTVTFDSVPGAPANIASVASPASNVSVARTFTNAGTFTYHCSIHPSMTGSVTVGTSVVAPPASPPPPSTPSGYLKHG